MIPLHYKQDKSKEEEYLKKIKEGRNDNCWEEIDKKCNHYLGMSFEAVILLSPDLLMKKQKEYDENPNRGNIKKEFKTILNKNEYIINTLYKTMPSKAREIVFRTAQVKACPYCNRNFIGIVDVGEGKKYKSFFELDHFLNKEDYPMFAVSLYNLIPVCPSCNRVKSTQKFSYYPYRSANRSDDLKFHYVIKGVDFLKDEALIEIELEKRKEGIASNIEGLYLKELYQTHKDLVQEIAGKVRYLGEDYLYSVCKQFPNLFSNEEEAYRMLYGNYYEPLDFSKRPLSKFTKDIYEDSLGGDL